MKGGRKDDGRCREVGPGGRGTGRHGREVVGGGRGRRGQEVFNVFLFFKSPLLYSLLSCKNPRKMSLLCRPIRGCPHTVYMVKNVRFDVWFTFLRNRNCKPFKAEQDVV